MLIILFPWWNQPVYAIETYNQQLSWQARPTESNYRLRRWSKLHKYEKLCQIKIQRLKLLAQVWTFLLDFQSAFAFRTSSSAQATSFIRRWSTWSCGTTRQSWEAFWQLMALASCYRGQVFVYKFNQFNCVLLSAIPIIPKLLGKSGIFIL